MPIDVTCACGRALNLRDELAGMSIRCPACAATLRVPILAAEIVEAIAAGPPPLPRPNNSDVAAGSPPVPRPTEPDAEQTDPAPMTRRERRRRRKRSRHWGEHAGEKQAPLFAFDDLLSPNAGILGGLFCIVMGIVAMLTCLSVGVLWFLPVLMIIVGVIALLRGLYDLY